MSRYVPAVLALLTVTAWGQQIIDVPAQHATIGAALMAAQHGDLIRVAPGIYNESISISKQITLEGAGRGQSIITSTGVGLTPINFFARTFETTVVRGFTITGGLRSGVYIDGASPTIYDCEIVANSSSMPGGGIRADQSQVRVIGCEIANNSTTGSGGGIWLGNAPNAVVIDCVIHNNSSGMGGGGASSMGTAVTFENCLFFENVATNNGGGLNVLFGVNTRVTGCTFADNMATSGGGAFASASTPIVSNTIVWGNQPPGLGGSFSITHSDVEGSGGAGTGNLDVNPLFVSPILDDYRLQPGSPCIDAGDPASPTDSDSTRADMGRVVPLLMLSPCALGNVNVDIGPVPLRPVMHVNTKHGGPKHRVDVPIGQSLSLTVSDPPVFGGPKNFALFVRTGVPTPGSKVFVPMLGELCYDPLHSPTLLVTESTGQVPTPLPGAPTPYTLPFPLGIPSPTRLTFVGLIIDDTTPRVMNAVLLNVY